MCLSSVMSQMSHKSLNDTKNVLLKLQLALDHDHMLVMIVRLAMSYGTVIHSQSFSRLYHANYQLERRGELDRMSP